MNNEGWQDWGGGKLQNENDPRDREFRGSGSDGRIRSCISRVETRFAQVCFSSLFLSFSFSSSDQQLSFSARNVSLLFSLRVSLSLSHTLTVVLVHSTKTKEATGPAWSEKRRAGKKEKREKGGTNLGAKRNRALPEGQREKWRTE